MGLIYRKHNGIGKANSIYVMDYMAYYRKEESRVRKSKVPYSKIESDGVRKSKSNNTDSNYPDCSSKHRSGYLTCPKQPYRKKKNSFCDFHQRDYDFDELERILLANPVKGRETK